MFGRNIRDKLPEINQPLEVDDEFKDKDMINKAKGKNYGDNKRKAAATDIQPGDFVLAKNMIKRNKLSPNFDSEKYVVLNKKGPEVLIRSSVTDKEYRRNVAHLKKISTEEEEGNELLLPENDSSENVLVQRPKRLSKLPTRYQK